MKLSNRSDRMPESPIRKLVPFAEAAKKAGKNVYHLNIGQPDIETPPPIMEAIRAFDEPVIEYGHSKGLITLREAVSDYFKRYGLKVGPEEIAITCGGSEAIFFAYTAIADPGDEIIVFEPFYANYNGYATMLNINLKAVTLRSDECFALPPREKIVEKITDKTRAIQICSPNNPTGKILTREEMDMLVDIATEHGLFIVSDEVYREFAYDGTPISLFEYPDFAESAIVVDSISKRFSACGARIGILASHNEEFMDRALRFGQARLCPPTLEQLGAEAAYKMDPSYFKPIREEYRRRRDVCVGALTAMDGVLCPNPGGAFYIIAKLPVDDADKFATFMLTDFDVDGETVMVAPADGFYHTPGLGKDEIRIAYVLEVEKLEKAMAILAEGIKAYNA